MSTLYLIAIGSNVRHLQHGGPAKVLRAALAVIEQQGMAIKAASAIISSAPIGPSLRRYANGAALIETSLPPERLLERLKNIERQFGRRRGGQSWRARVLDLDIILWSGGAWASNDLIIPHPLFRKRAFVLGPAAAIAPRWRDPITHLLLEHLHGRLTKCRPLPIGRSAITQHGEGP